MSNKSLLLSWHTIYRKWSIKRPGRLFNFRTKRGGRLIDTRRLLEGGVYFLSKVMYSNHYRNKLTPLLKGNNFELEQDTISKPLIQRGR